MATPNAFLVQYTILRVRNADLRKTLARELANLRGFNAMDATGDSADVAFANSSDEVSSQLAALDAREVTQTERALTRWTQGAYGVCEKCQKQIRAARLNVLPSTTLCISCERELEKCPVWQHWRGRPNWAQVVDAEASLQDQQIDLCELERQQSSEP